MDKRKSLEIVLQSPTIKTLFSNLEKIANAKSQETHLDIILTYRGINFNHDLPTAFKLVLHRIYELAEKEAQQVVENEVRRLGLLRPSLITYEQMHFMRSNSPYQPIKLNLKSMQHILFIFRIAYVITVYGGKKDAPLTYATFSGYLKTHTQALGYNVVKGSDSHTPPPSFNYQKGIKDTSYQTAIEVLTAGISLCSNPSNKIESTKKSQNLRVAILKKMIAMYTSIAREKNIKVLSILGRDMKLGFMSMKKRKVMCTRKQ